MEFSICFVVIFFESFPNQSNPRSKCFCINSTNMFLWTHKLYVSNFLHLWKDRLLQFFLNFFFESEKLKLVYLCLCAVKHSMYLTWILHRTQIMLLLWTLSSYHLILPFFSWLHLSSSFLIPLMEAVPGGAHSHTRTKVWCLVFVDKSHSTVSCIPVPGIFILYHIK